ncbi:MAG TPA: ABC transporter permease [Planctomycetaceae bacterium]|nr:ABC transporter permease [Planctomycetaceae bacterium]
MPSFLYFESDSLLAGPIFSREVLTAPRQTRHFIMRAGYVVALFVLMYTAAQATFGWQQVTSLGETARFGGLLFQLFSMVQLALVLFFAPLFAASRVAQEKDRQTLVLLLMTDLKDRELVFGKLLASLLPVAMLLAASAPVFTLISVLGGVSIEQIGWSLAICAGAALAAGSWGSLVAFWREKTFQTLAISVLGLVLFIGVVEAGVAVLGSNSDLGRWLGWCDPFRGMLLVLDPLAAETGLAVAAVPAWPYVIALVVLALIANGVAVLRLRAWNPSRTFTDPFKEAEAEAAATRSATRTIWKNPVIWREIRTKAYGHKVALIKLAYLVVFVFAAIYVYSTRDTASELMLGLISPPGFAFVAVGLVALLLVNAQAVTALTSERDAKTLELLLVTDITAKEFIFGKIGGVLYNMLWPVVLPLAGLVWLTAQGLVTWENFIYVALGFILLTIFAAMLGLHSGLSFDNSRSAIANSLGTMFFLFLGVFVCMMLIVEARSSFFQQITSFLVFILGGSMGLWASLTHRNPSSALSAGAFILPFATFYSITGFLLGETLGPWLMVSFAYGFTVLAMLVPAVSEFDVALGRTTLDKG